MEGPKYVLRSFRYALDPTPRQTEVFQRFAGSARWAYNWALGMKVSSHESRRNRISALQGQGMSPQQAKEAFEVEAAEASKEVQEIEITRKALFHALKGHTTGTSAVPLRLAFLTDEVSRTESELSEAQESGDKKRIEAAQQNFFFATNEYQALKNIVGTSETLEVADLRLILKKVREKIIRHNVDLYYRGYRFPSSMALSGVWNSIRDLPKEEGGSPWHREITRDVFTSSFSHVDVAWKNWIDSLSGKRSQKHGYPRFKKKGRCRDSFTIWDGKSRIIRPESRRRASHKRGAPVVVIDRTEATTGRLVRGGYKTLYLPKKLGHVRLLGGQSTKRLARLVDRGQATVQSVTISRSGVRWYASVSCRVSTDAPVYRKPRATHRAPVAVMWGTKKITLKSDSLEELEQPRYLRKQAERLAAAQRIASHKILGSGKRAKANTRVARLHHHIAEQRKSWLHELTTRLADHEIVAVEAVRAQSIVRKDAPRCKRRNRNKAILDTAPGMFLSQVKYKASWNDRTFINVDSGIAMTTCSECRKRNPSFPVGQVFECLALWVLC